jgi:hypothetical protein
MEISTGVGGSHGGQFLGVRGQQHRKDKAKLSMGMGGRGVARQPGLGLG